MGGGGNGILHPRDLSSTPPQASLDGLLSATSVCSSLRQNSTENPLHPLLSRQPGHLPLPCYPHNSTPHVHIRGLSSTHLETPDNVYMRQILERLDSEM